MSIIKKFIKGKKDCVFCKVTRYGMVFALGLVVGIAWAVLQSGS
ncbi:hypothetical protein ACFLZY_02725 [Patescibacteria group bacterium]